MVDAAEHFWTESSLAIVQLGLHLDCARLRVQGVGDAGDASFKDLARVGHQTNLDTLALLHEPDVTFRDLRGHPDGTQVGNRHDAGAGVVSELTRHNVQLEHLPGERRSQDDLLLKIAGLQPQDGQTPVSLFL